MSIRLGTTQKLQLVTGAAKTLDVLVGWFDGTNPDSQETLVSTATTTDVCTAPGAGVRDIDFINVVNRDAAACNVTLQKYDSTGSKTTILRQTLALNAGYTLTYTHRGAWGLFDDQGRPVSLTTAIGAPLDSAKILVGNASNLAAAVAMSGDGVLANDGTFSLLNAVNEIALTGAASATLQRCHVCSGTSADYTVTLPAPAAGKLIAFRMDSALTKLVTLDAGSGKTIDGAQTRVMWANETCILMGVSSTAWVKIAGKSIPMRSRMYLGSNQTSLSNGAYGDVNLATVQSGADPASMADTGAHTITIRRAGLYRLFGQISYYGGATTWNQLLCSIWANGTTNIVATELNSQSFSGGAPTFPASMQCVASAGDALKLRYYQSSSGGTPILCLGSNATFLEVEELLSW